MKKKKKDSEFKRVRKQTQPNIYVVVIVLKILELVWWLATVTWHVSYMLNWVCFSTDNRCGGIGNTGDTRQTPLHYFFTNNDPTVSESAASYVLLLGRQPSLCVRIRWF